MAKDNIQTFSVMSIQKQKIFLKNKILKKFAFVPQEKLFSPHNPIPLIMQPTLTEPQMYPFRQKLYKGTRERKEYQEESEILPRIPGTCCQPEFLAGFGSLFLGTCLTFRDFRKYMDELVCLNIK